MSTTEPAPTTTVATTRDQIRDAIFAAKPKSEVITFFGVKVEVRQPDLGAILEKREQGQQDQTFGMLLDYTFVPGTQDRVFDATDVDSIRLLPFGEDMQVFSRTVNNLLGLDIKALEAEMNDATKST